MVDDSAAITLNAGLAFSDCDPRHYVPSVDEAAPLAKLLGLPADDIFRVELYASVVYLVELILLGSPNRAIEHHAVSAWKSIAGGKLAPFAGTAREGGVWASDIAQRGGLALLESLAPSPLPSNESMARAAILQKTARANSVRLPTRRGQPKDDGFELLARFTARLATRFNVNWTLPRNGDIRRNERIAEREQIADFSTHAPFAIFIELQKLVTTRAEALIKAWNLASKIRKSDARSLLARVNKLKAKKPRQLSDKLRVARVV